MRMLIVDDVVTNCAVMKRMAMRVFEGEIDTVTSPASAILACRENTYDIVVTDYMMPEIDGISMVSIIRDIDDYKDVPIIMTSASPSPWLPTVSKENGIDEFITKPINMADFRGLIVKYTGRFTKVAGLEWDGGTAAFA